MAADWWNRTLGQAQNAVASLNADAHAEVESFIDNAQKAAANVMALAGSNPTHYAQARTLGQVLSWPTSTVLRNPQAATRRYRAVQARQAFSGAPHTTQVFSSPTVAAMAHDGMVGLSWVEKHATAALSWAGEHQQEIRDLAQILEAPFDPADAYKAAARNQLGQAFVGGVAGGTASVVRGGGSVLDAGDVLASTIARELHLSHSARFYHFQDDFDRAAQPLQTTAEALAIEHPNFLQSGASSIGSMVPVAGAALADPALGAIALGFQGADTAHRAAVAHGASDLQTASATLLTGEFYAASALIPGSKLWVDRVLPAAGGPLGAFVRNYAAEGVRGFAQGYGMKVGENAAARLTYDPNRGLQQGAVASGVRMAAFNTALRGLHDTVSAARTAASAGGGRATGGPGVTAASAPDFARVKPSESTVQSPSAADPVTSSGQASASRAEPAAGVEQLVTPAVASQPAVDAASVEAPDALGGQVQPGAALQTDPAPEPELTTSTPTEPDLGAGPQPDSGQGLPPDRDSLDQSQSGSADLASDAPAAGALGLSLQPAADDWATTSDARQLNSDGADGGPSFSDPHDAATEADAAAGEPSLPGATSGAQSQPDDPGAPQPVTPQPPSPETVRLAREMLATARAPIVAAHLDEVVHRLRTSPIPDRIPELPRRLLQTVSGDEAVHIQAGKFRQALAGASPADQLAALDEPSVYQQLQATPTDADIRIPLAHYLLRIGRTPLYEALRGDARLRSDGRSPNQAAGFDADAAPDYPEADWSKPTPGLYRADPREIRFTQYSVSPNFSSHGTIDETVDALRKGLSPDEVGPPIRVVVRDGVPFSLDNRRLLAFNFAGLWRIRVNVLDWGDPALIAEWHSKYNPIRGDGRHVSVVKSREREIERKRLIRLGVIKGWVR